MTNSAQSEVNIDYDDYDDKLALENIANANSSDPMVIFTSSIKRVMNADPKIFSLTITNQCCINLECLIHYESEDDTDPDNTADANRVIINRFYSSLGLEGYEDNDYPTMGQWISKCPNIHSITIDNLPNVKGTDGKTIDFLHDSDKVHFFEEIHNENSSIKVLVFKNCRFDDNSNDNIEALLENPNIECVKMYECHFALGGCLVFAEAESSSSITRLELYNCVLETSSRCDGADVEMSNVLTTMPSLTAVICKQCMLGPTAMRIMYNIRKENRGIASIENL